MSKIYFVRHGESQWNVEDKICGQTDIPLTERGHAQAEETGRRIVEKGDHSGGDPLLSAFTGKRHRSTYFPGDGDSPESRAAADGTELRYLGGNFSQNQ